ncbi:MAG: hypothetical protein ACTSR0_07570, partial [Candidatus Asgardarchaeia archaeon]
CELLPAYAGSFLIHRCLSAFQQAIPSSRRFIFIVLSMAKYIFYVAPISTLSDGDFPQPRVK